MTHVRLCWKSAVEKLMKQKKKKKKKFRRRFIQNSIPTYSRFNRGNLQEKLRISQQVDAIISASMVSHSGNACTERKQKRSCSLSLCLCLLCCQIVRHVGICWLPSDLPGPPPRSNLANGCTAGVVFCGTLFEMGKRKDFSLHLLPSDFGVWRARYRL